MKRFLTLALTCLPLLCFGATTYTTYFNNTHTYTNATVAGAARVGSLVSTNGITGQDLTADRAAFTDSNKKLVSTGTSAALSGALSDETGSGGVAVFASNPSLAGLTSSAEIVSTLGSISADASALDATATWNNAGVTFTGLKLNITDTASAAGSLLMDLQLGGNPRLQIQKTGGLISWGASSAAAGGFFTALTGDTVARAALAIDTTGTPNFGFGPGNASRDTFLLRDAANTLAQRNGANAQTFRVYNTYTDASNFESGGIGWSGNVLFMFTGNGGTGTARNLQVGPIGSASLNLATANTVRWTVNSSGHLLAFADNTYDIGASGATRPRNIYAAGGLVAGGGIEAGTAQSIYFSTRSSMSSSADGVLRIANNAATDFNRLQFGGTSASFPAEKRSGTGLIDVLADDSGPTWRKGTQLVEAKTADYAVLTTDSKGILTNEGTTAIRNNTLPGAAAGLTYTFIVQDTDGLTVTAAAGDTIRIAASVSAAAGNITTTTVGNTVTIVAINATEWIATSVVGTWTVN